MSDQPQTTISDSSGCVFYDLRAPCQKDECGVCKSTNGTSKPTEELCRLPNGYTLYRTPNEVGGYRYASDEIGGGVCVWDTSLVDESTLLAALTEEARRIRDEYRRKQR